MQPSTLGRWCPGAQKHFKLALALRRVALSGNTLLIVTLSIVLSFVALLLLSELTQRKSIKLCQTFESEPDLKCTSEAWSIRYPPKLAPILPILDVLRRLNAT